jgi:hypothetical protein
MRLPPPSFNVLGELHDRANSAPVRGKARGRNRFEQDAQERVRSVEQGRLCRDPPLLSVELSNPVGVQVTAARVKSSPIVRFDVRITVGDPVGGLPPTDTE